MFYIFYLVLKILTYGLRVYSFTRVQGLGFMRFGFKGLRILGYKILRV